MMHSTVTSKGQTTIPEKIRKALRIKPGDKLEYAVEETEQPFVCIEAFGHLRVHSLATRERVCPFAKFAKLLPKPHAARAHGEQAQTC